MTKLPNAYNPLLDAIAAALGVPVEDFFANSTGSESENVLNLLKAWVAIGNAQGQRRVLSLAQHEAERSTASAATPRPDVVPFRRGDN
ncbi:hypothetical protein [Methylobacterium sp. J-067]|uniref:hypothetical protein n=1 Tax=Methylobacterium sp. J-067 TaxID=2836648 RepID=UPI001FB9364E|nr:hypothetical protein [Methylobacterium sp. J-067]MCJ2023661.1 hypothetical protein [Methylobacterium sp. J-067]